MTHVVAWLPGVGDGAALILVSNVAALVATALMFVLVRQEPADTDLARRSIWYLSLAPAAFVLVMGYAESVLLCLFLGCFLALRRGDEERPNFALAGLFGFGAALTRPIGVLVALVIAVELIRWWARLQPGPRRVGLLAVAAPFLGLAAFLGWADHVVGDAWAPLRVQLESSHHGGVSDPFATLFDDAKGLLHHHARHRTPRAVGAAGRGVAGGVLAAVARLLHRPGPGHFGRGPGRRQPRFLRALCPERLPAGHCRRRAGAGTATGESRPGPALGRPGGIRPAGLP